MSIDAVLGGSLLVVSGPPGAGKSTVARRLADRTERSVVVEGDAFFGFLASGRIEPWLPAARYQNDVVLRAAASAAGAFARDGYSTVFDGVLGPWSVAGFAEGAGLDRVDYVVLLPAVELCIQRVATRSHHAFADEAATRTMHAEFTAAVRDGVHVVSSEASVEEVVALVDRMRSAGQLAYRLG